MRMFTAGIALVFGLLPAIAGACDITVAGGANLHSVVAANAARTICLAAGTYDLGTTTLAVPSGTQLRGTGSDRDAVVLNSAATRAIRVGNRVMLRNFLLNGPGASSEFGVLAYGNDDVILWGLRVRNFGISIGVHTSSNVDIWDTFMSANGNLANGAADPNLWVTGSRDVVVLYGELRGRGNGPGGDGEAAVYRSTNVTIDGLHVVDSGASGIYLVNCDDCAVRNTVIHRANEWGIDVVQGSDRFVAENNAVYWSKFGGSVFDEAGSISGIFRGNTFYQNRQMGVGACNGINVIGEVAAVTQSGNSSDPAGVICKYQ
jgi:parallel beta-helix repeat protein